MRKRRASWRACGGSIAQFQAQDRPAAIRLSSSGTPTMTRCRSPAPGSWIWEHLRWRSLPPSRRHCPRLTKDCASITALVLISIPVEDQRPRPIRYIVLIQLPRLVSNGFAQISIAWAWVLSQCILMAWLILITPVAIEQKRHADTSKNRRPLTFIGLAPNPPVLEWILRLQRSQLFQRHLVSSR